MTKLFIKFALAAGAMVVLPGMAQAGSSTASGAASMNVLNQCSVTGASVSLGTYSASQTWGDVGAALGKADPMNNFYSGSLGSEYLNFGSVTCDAGMPYTLTIEGSYGYGAIVLPHNGKRGRFWMAVKKLGNTVMADNWTSGGGHVFQGDVLNGVGTGSAQPLVGNVFMHNLTTVYWDAPDDSETLGVAGVATDTLTYTLNF